MPSPENNIAANVAGSKTSAGLFPRAFAPAQSAVSPACILGLARELKQAGTLDEQSRKELKRLIGIQYAGSGIAGSELTSSGTAALFSIFGLLARGAAKRVVLMSAYTCPEIAAAVVRVGLQVGLVDVSPQTLRMRPDSISVDLQRDVLAVVLSNLYGLPDSTLDWLQLAEQHNFAIVDDACQSALSSVRNVPIGARDGCLGVMSFGRGKAFSGVGGGAILVPEKPLAAASRVTGEILKGDVTGPADFGARKYLYGAAISLLTHPALYAIVARIPGLGIGETGCHIDFHTGPISTADALYAVAQMRRQVALASTFTARAEQWKQLIPRGKIADFYRSRSEAHKDEKIVPTRYPLLLPNEDSRTRLLDKYGAKHLGASASYPRTLDEYPELRQSIRHADIPGAKALAKQLITLPVHDRLSNADVEQLANLLEKSI